MDWGGIGGMVLGFFLAVVVLGVPLYIVYLLIRALRKYVNKG